VNFGEPISGHCEAATLSFGMQVKRLAGGAAHSAQAGDVYFTKETDSLSRGLFLNSTKASKPLTVTIEVWKKTAKAPTLIYTLKNANIFCIACTIMVEWKPSAWFPNPFASIFS
jgi:type VI protein secretion system component Hcp